MQDAGTIEVIFSIAILIMSVVVHEVSHGVMALALGDPTAKISGRLTLNPLKHLDPVGSFIVPLITSLAGFAFGWAKPVPYNPYNLQAGKWGPALVGAVGPLSNILVAIIFGLAFRLEVAYQLPASLLLITTQIVVINIVLAVFNLMPIPPLDGSKVLFSLLPYRYIHIQETMEKYQLVLVLALILFGWEIVIHPIITLLYSLII